MECAVCKSKVSDFKLRKLEDVSSPSPSSVATHVEDNSTDAYNQVFVTHDDPSIQDFFDRAQGASTPIPRSQSFSTAKSTQGDDKIVLRIDNVPWVSLSLSRGNLWWFTCLSSV
jgi:hypothetical protein